MSAHIMYHPTGAASAKALADALGIQASREGPEERVDTLIRYGTYRSTRFKPAKLLINSKAALEQRGQRHDMLATLSDAGIPVPPFTTSAMKIPVDEHGFTTNPIMVRHYPATDEQPHRGAGIAILGTGSTLPITGDLYLTLLPKSRQWRVHCLLGYTRIHELVPENDDVMRRAVWNDDGPFNFVLSHTYPKQVKAMALASLAALDLQLGAVDIIETPSSQIYVLEVNTAPGITGMAGTLEWYTSILSHFCH